jgi:hypothetical protein
MMVTRGWDDATMKVEVWQKDMTIIDNALRALCLPSPLFAACIPIYHAAMAQGHALHDTAAVYAVLEKFAGESLWILHRLRRSGPCVTRWALFPPA